jgi:hypothetical protein
MLLKFLQEVQPEMSAEKLALLRCQMRGMLSPESPSDVPLAFASCFDSRAFQKLEPGTMQQLIQLTLIHEFVSGFPGWLERRRSQD